MFQSSISPDQIAALELASFPGEIVVVNAQDETFAQAVKYLKRQKVLKLGRHSLRPRPAIIKDIYAVGFPSIVMQAIGSVMMIGYNTILAAEPTAVAVLGAYQKLQSFVFMPVFGLNQGALPLMGYNYGARNRERLMKTYKLALLSAITIMAIGFLLFQSIPHLFLKLFSADAKMLQMGIPALRRISICFLPAAYGIMTSTLFQATGHGTYSLFSSLIRQLIGILPLAYILYHYGGVEVSWLSFPLAEILGVLYMVLTFRHLYVKEIKNLDQITEN